MCIECALTISIHNETDSFFLACVLGNNACVQNVCILLNMNNFEYVVCLEICLNVFILPGIRYFSFLSNKTINTILKVIIACVYTSTSLPRLCSAGGSIIMLQVSLNPSLSPT